MSSKTQIDQLLKANVRIAAMWPFPCLEPSATYLDTFSGHEEAGLPPKIAGLIENWSKAEKRELFQSQGDIAERAHSELSDLAYSEGIFGFIAEVSVPCFNAYPDGTMSLSWGSYTSQLVLAETYEGLVIQAAALGEARYNEAKASVAALPQPSRQA
ncbi:hypothetical protein [Croceicoccus gelatinilyticus]|uniref:hypothetical protein n=1 Tax=Croceicoccus gelatinilyticus TaxID=2835536 RepID=UPI001BD0AE85|nr:hypothetical protein [Croceicoccus gelatinilyticus]MBS7671740.1 hypothetical protein [Croceicoccus gelatinilyticus]